mmetsp:Transcript_90037/g.179754  ORF Transcript_90037/g.179754 Transcript_90037/m.179754 type:complete len:167 (+) Transcript_90037:84-584(+)
MMNTNIIVCGDIIYVEGNVVISSKQAKSRPTAGGGGAASAKALKRAPKPTAAGQLARKTGAKSRPAPARQAAAAEAPAASASAVEEGDTEEGENEEIGKFIVEKCTTVNKKSVHVGTRTFDTRRKATDAQAQMDKEWNAFKENSTLTAQGVDDFKKHLKDVFDSFM